MRRAILTLAVLAVAAVGWAITQRYSSGLAGLTIGAANLPTTFTDNHSGGLGVAFLAKHVTICPRAGSDICWADLDGVAAVGDLKVDPALGCLVAAWDDSVNGVGGGWNALGGICGAGDAATWDVVAGR